MSAYQQGDGQGASPPRRRPPERRARGPHRSRRQHQAQPIAADMSKPASGWVNQRGRARMVAWRSRDGSTRGSGRCASASPRWCAVRRAPARPSPHGRRRAGRRPLGRLGRRGADPARGSEDSLVQPYSVSQAVRGPVRAAARRPRALDLDAPVQRYWPEFRAAATVRHVLSHQAGSSRSTSRRPTEAFYDWDRMCALLAAQEPAWEPGTAHGESALFYGHLVGELVRRVDGRSPGRFLREEVCGPAGLDFALRARAPAEQARAVELTGLDAAFARRNQDGQPAAVPARDRQPAGHAGRARSSTRRPGARRRSPRSTATAPPAASPASTRRCCAASSLSGRLLRRGDDARSAPGLDRVFGFENAWGLGFGVDDDGYGMGGLGGSVGGSCTGRRLRLRVRHRQRGEPRPRSTRSRTRCGTASGCRRCPPDPGGLVPRAAGQRLSRPGSPGLSARQVPRSGSYSSRSNSSMSSPSRISE